MGDPAWELPAFEATIFRDGAHRHALVIPVLNEGERIRGQLRRLAELAPAVDIVIADGGSTDGSLDDPFLQSLGVRARLVKTGAGKLGAQLRMAYAWCLEQGYDGVVTVDGNGKDGMEAVETFVAKLREGFDLVQGSRFVRGGEAVNTPLDRHVANRLVHAPLISLAAGFWYTDTTNGFRAYSRRLLEDRAVAPFRDVFDRYGLLFYMSVRAPRLGYRVTEVPVRRAYPAGEKPPTKIGGLRGKLGILAELAQAVTQGYTPGSPGSSVGRAALVLALPMIAMVALFLRHLSHPPYGADAWFYFELSRSVFHDFYRVVTERSFMLDGPYSAAFPPRWPVLIAVTDAVTGLGARSGYVLAFLAFSMTCLLSEWLARDRYRIRWAGLAAAMLLIALAGFRKELLGGGTVPLQVLLYAAMLLVFLRSRLAGLAPAVILGALAGISVLNRFDVMPFAALLAAAILIYTRRIGPALAYIAVLLIVLSPWILYSHQQFGVFFATDNGWVATAVDKTAYATDWRPDGVMTLADDPIGWLRKVIGNALWLVVLMGDDLLPPVLALAVAVSLLGRSRVGGLKAVAREGLRDDSVRRTALFALAMAGPLAGYVATGYLIGRYYGPWYWLVLVMAIGVGATLARSAAQRDVLGAALLQVAALLVLFWSMVPGATSADGVSFPRNMALDRLHACLSDRPKSAVLFVGDDVAASRFGAVYGVRSVLMPRNLDSLDPAPLRRFIDARGITHLFVAKPELAKDVELIPGLGRQDGCAVPLYVVAK